MEGIVAVFIPIAFVIVVGLVTKWLSDNRVRRELVQANASPEMIASLMQRPIQDLDASLKWGMVAVAIGLALVGIQLLRLDESDPLSFGLIFICGGGGLLAFYAIKSRL